MLFAFLPLLFLPEGAGIFIRSLPAAVLYTVAASLFVALTVIPFLASRMLQGAAATAAAGNRALQGMMRVHPRHLRARRCESPWASPTRTLLAALAFVRRRRSASPAAAGLQPVPDADIPQFRIAIETPTGASLADTDRAVRFVEAELAARTEKSGTTSANVGRGNPRVYYNIFPEETKANVGEMFIELRALRSARHARPCSKSCAPQFDALPGRAHHGRGYRNGPPINAPIEIAVVGPDLDQLQQLANQAEDDHRGDARHARRRQPGASSAHRPRPATSTPTRQRCSAWRRWRSTAPCARRSPA